MVSEETSYDAHKEQSKYHTKESRWKCVGRVNTGLGRKQTHINTEIYARYEVYVFVALGYTTRPIDLCPHGGTGE